DAQVLAQAAGDGITEAERDLLRGGHALGHRALQRDGHGGGGGAALVGGGPRGRHGRLGVRRSGGQQGQGTERQRQAVRRRVSHKCWWGRLLSPAARFSAKLW